MTTPPPVALPGAAARSVATTVLARVSRIAMAGIASVILARSLQPHGMGTYSLVVVVAIGTISLGHLSVEHAQVTLWRRPGIDRSAIAGSALTLGMAGGTAAAAVTASLAVLTSPPWAVGQALYIALAASPFLMTVFFVSNVALLRDRVDVVNRGWLLSGVFQCTGLLCLTGTGWLTVDTAAVIWAISAAVPLAVLLPAVRPRFADANSAVSLSLVGTGLRYHVGNAAQHLLTRGDVLILGAMLPPAAVGLYTLAVTLGEQARIVTDAVCQAMLARQMDADPDRAADVTLRVLRLSTVVAAATVGLLCLAAPFAVPLVYGAAFAGSVPAILALAPGLFLFLAARPINAYLLRLDRPWWQSAITCAAVVVTLGCDLLLIPRWGVIGCALGATLGYTVLVGATLLWFARASGTRPRDFLPGAPELRRLPRTARSLITSR